MKSVRHDVTDMDGVLVRGSQITPVAEIEL
jgi:hypothetical protein